MRLKTYTEFYNELFDGLGPRYILLPRLNSEEVVALADTTVSTMSTLLMTALFAHKKIAFVWSKSSERELFESSGLLAHPLVLSDGAPMIRSPRPLEQGEYSLQPEQMKRFPPYSPEPLAQAVQELLA